MSTRTPLARPSRARHLLRRVGAAALGLITATGLVACGNDTAEPTEITIVTSTNVYGSVAKAIAGNYAKITSIIDGPQGDPHSYEASAKDIAALQDADIAIVNGGGYDRFAITALVDTPSDKIINAYNFLQGDTDVDEIAPSMDAAGNPIKEQQHGGEDADEAIEKAASTAASMSAEAAEDTHGHGDAHGHHHAPDAPNEHVFYNVDVMEDVAEALTQKLTSLDPTNEVSYKANLTTFSKGLETIRETLHTIAKDKPHTPFVQTEPLATFLAANADMVDITPEGYAEAVENGADIPALLASQMEEILKAKKPAVFLFNTQNANSATKAARKLAEQNGIAIIPLTETLPVGLDYITWMQENVQALAEALHVAK